MDYASVKNTQIMNEKLDLFLLFSFFIFYHFRFFTILGFHGFIAMDIFICVT